jgi:hypothetical protein
MTVLIIFQSTRFRDFKNFYTGFLLVYWQDYFPILPSYPRFVALINRAIFPMGLFAQVNSGKRTGIYYIDSSCLPACHLKRSLRHKTFAQLAQYGRTSVGWFFGLKLPLRRIYVAHWILWLTRYITVANLKHSMSSMIITAKGCSLNRVIRYQPALSPYCLINWLSHEAILK